MEKAILKYKTSKPETSVLKRRVFCAFHPQNQKTAGKIMQDILCACDCTAFYYETGIGPQSQEALEEDLSKMALFVFVVSSDFLFTPSFARDVAFDFALRHMIPILPIMTENGLEDAFNARMGSLQYLLMNAEQYDASSVPFAEKLSNYLSKVFVTELDVQRLRAAFDASIFLSYRKKDRLHAQKLLNMIHDEEACRGLAIWYDEFLVPGEDFNDGIRSELENSAAFILVITPNVVEENNYIAMTEYPAALSLGKTVLPFEMLSTDRAKLTMAYPGITDPVSNPDAQKVRCAILSAVDTLGLQTMESSHEKDYLRGISYLRGIYVEKNTDIGVRMILSAARQGVTAAIATAVMMYRTGEGVPLSLPEAEHWQKQYIDILKTREECDIKQLARAYFELSSIYEQSGDLQASIGAYNELLDFSKSEFVEDSSFLKELQATTLEAMAALWMQLGNYSKARHMCLGSSQNIRQEQFEADQSLLSRLKLIEVYARLADCCENCQDIAGMKENMILIKRLIPAPDSITSFTADQYETVKRILVANNKLGHLYVRVDDTNQAFLCIGNSVLLAEKLKQISDGYDARHQLVLAHINDGDQHAYKKAENHLHAAEDAYDRAYEEINELLATGEDSLELKRNRAQIVQKRAFVKKELGMPAEAESSYSEAIRQFQDILETFDTNPVKKDLYDCLREASAVYEQLKNTDTCEKLLKKSIALAEDAVKHSELAVYKKDLAASYGLLAQLYKKQWDMDESLRCRKAQLTLLRTVSSSTGRFADLKLYAIALKDTISAAKLAGEFGEASALNQELAEFTQTYRDFFN